jgi:hypothetical protein
MGVDGLEGLDKIRTEAANQTYAATARIVLFVPSMKSCVRWRTLKTHCFGFFPEMSSAMMEIEGFSFSFHNCMHGGDRKKLTKWWSTKDVFAELQSLCDGKHQHAQWNSLQQESALQYGRNSRASTIALSKNGGHTLTVCNLKRCSASLYMGKPSCINGVDVSQMGFGYASQGERLEPLVSECQSYCFFLVNPSKEPDSSTFFRSNRKDQNGATTIAVGKSTGR